MILDILKETGSKSDEDACCKISALTITPELMLERNDIGATPLHIAVSIRFPKCVELLLERGADIEIKSSRDGYTPLHVAAMWDETAEVMVPVLATRGADMNAKGGEANKCCTPLMLAMTNRQHIAVATLLDHGANIEERDPNLCTPLYMASGYGFIDMVTLLVGRGAVVDAIDDRGNTPLLSAAFGGHLDVVRYLVEHGADAKHKNNSNRDAAWMADHDGHQAVKDYLLSA